MPWWTYFILHSNILSSLKWRIALRSFSKGNLYQIRDLLISYLSFSAAYICKFSKIWLRWIWLVLRNGVRQLVTSKQLLVPRLKRLIFVTELGDELSHSSMPTVTSHSSVKLNRKWQSTWSVILCNAANAIFLTQMKRIFFLETNGMLVTAIYTEKFLKRFILWGNI